MNILEHKLEENIEIVRILAKPQRKVRQHGLLFKYKTPDKPNKVQDYRAKSFQTVTEVCVEVGSVPKNTVIVKCKEGCLHPIVAFGLCTECGKDLKDDETISSERSVSMLHAIPQVSVSVSEASALGMSDILHQLKRKKLTLVVDLDQTIIHTSTTDNIPEGIPGVFHFYLSNKKFRYSTRLRPGTLEFLKDMSRLYELHVFTMGARDYADTITSYIDPDRKIFSSRILSRDECFDNHSKVHKLQALFPKGDRMVVIIDDRFDMWTNCPNLIRVRPYSFFEDVGDINDPNSRHSKLRKDSAQGYSEIAQFKKNKPLDIEQTSFCVRTAHSNIKCVEHVPLLKNGSVDYSKVFQILKSLLLDGNFELALLHVQRVSDKLSRPDSGQSSSEPEEVHSILDTQELKNELAEAMDTEESSETTEESSANTEESTASNNTSSKRVKFSENSSHESSENEHEPIISTLCKHKDHVKSLSEFYIKYVEGGPERQKERDVIRMSSPLFKLYSGKAETDQDRYLDTLGGLLTKIHDKFYENYTETLDVEKLPDTKTILPQLREVLSDSYIVFSGIIPTNFPNPRNHPIWCAALQMGASVSMTLVKSGTKRTTHLVTSRSDTGKVHQALKMGIKIVTDQWLWRCFEVWENYPTTTFEWQGLTGGKRSKSRSPEPMLAELKTELKASLGEGVLEAMTSEVDDILANGSESDYSSPTDSEDSSEAESMESNELTGPPAEDPTLPTRKRSRSEVDAEEEEELLGDRDEGEQDGYGSDNSLEGELMDELEAEFTDQLDEAAEGDNWKCTTDT